MGMLTPGHVLWPRENPTKMGIRLLFLLHADIDKGDNMPRHAFTAFITSLAAAAVFTAPLTHAQYTGPSNTPAATVEEILADPIDDQEVTLRGHILRQVSSKNYLFSDGTAEILAKIKEKRFRGLPPIDENTEVEIHGKVDTGKYRAPKIEVKELQLVP